MPRYLRTRTWDRPVNHCTGEARNMAPKVIMPGFSPAARARLIMASSRDRAEECCTDRSDDDEWGDGGEHQNDELEWREPIP